MIAECAAAPFLLNERVFRACLSCVPRICGTPPARALQKDFKLPDLTPFAQSSADHLRLVIETGQIGIWELDLQSGAAIRNARHDQIFGYDEPLDEWTYAKFLDHVVAVDRERVDELQKLAVERKETWEFECRIKRADGEERWISAAGRPLKGPGGEVEKLIGHVMDVTQTKQREARLALITQELNHRVRNILTMISSMVRMSARQATDIRSFAQALEGRVGALARSHELLVTEESASLTPSDILEMELAAFPDLRSRTRIESRDQVELSGQAGQGLALIFHELITNGIKYGAFSNDCGRVEVDIGRLGQGTRIEWKENDGPAVAPPEKTGFGSTLMKRAGGSNGKVRMHFESEGVRCEIILDP